MLGRSVTKLIRGVTLEFHNFCMAWNYEACHMSIEKSRFQLQLPIFMGSFSNFQLYFMTVSSLVVFNGWSGNYKFLGIFWIFVPQTLMTLNLMVFFYYYVFNIWISTFVLIIMSPMLGGMFPRLVFLCVILYCFGHEYFYEESAESILP